MQTSGPLRGHSSLRAVLLGQSPGRRPPPSMPTASTWKGALPLPNHPGPTSAVGSPPVSSCRSAERDRQDWRAGMRRRRRSCPMPPDGAGRTSPPASRSGPRIGPEPCRGSAPAPASSVDILRGRSGLDRPRRGGARGAGVALHLPPGPARLLSRMGASDGPDRAAGSHGVRGAAFGAPGSIDSRMRRHNLRAGVRALGGCRGCWEGRGARSGFGETGCAPVAQKRGDLRAPRARTNMIKDALKRRRHLRSRRRPGAAG